MGLIYFYPSQAKKYLSQFISMLILNTCKFKTVLMLSIETEKGGGKPLKDKYEGSLWVWILQAQLELHPLSWFPELAGKNQEHH